MNDANTLNDSDTAALLEGIKANTETKVVMITTGLDTEDGPKEVAVIARSNGQHGVKLESVQPFIDEYRLRPKRIVGSSTHDTIDSFIAHVQKYGDKDTSALFADQAGLCVRAVYDYHQPDAPAYLAHKATFAPAKSRQLIVWQGNNTRVMSQGEFANFIENNILDVCPPPTGSEKRDADEAHTDIAKQLNTTIASPSKLLELARGISITESAVAKSFVNTDNGTMSLEYTTSQADGNGKKLTVPGLFLIGIPVFESGLAYRVLVRLRFRMKDQKVLWWYELHKLEDSIDAAYEEVIDKVTDETDLPLYYGTAEG